MASDSIDSLAAAEAAIRAGSPKAALASLTAAVKAAPAKAQLRIKASAEAQEGRGFPEWVEVDAKALKGTFKARPQRSELSSTINESLVVELYSK